MKTVKYLALGLLAATGAFAQKPIKVITTASLNPTGVTTFDRDTVYHLQFRVFVGQSAAQPQELTIESGTVIKGLPGEFEQAATLIITKWGKIHANGTAAQPILFTTVYDNGNDPSDLGPFDRGMWGGVIILGNATISEGSARIEGVDTSEARAVYGGALDTDNSGEFTYVSIRHGGKIIGGANEINGLTMGGVGSGTTIHHVEVFANNDDGFEWFGGTVNAKHLVSAYGNDDAFDFDFGYKGKLQYGFAAYHHANIDPNGNQAIEGDGFSMPLGVTTDPSKYSNPTWSNLSLIGSGNPQTVSPANDFAFRLRDGTAGDFKNMVLQNWRQSAGRFDVQGAICQGLCQFDRDSLNIEGSVFWNFGSYSGSFANLFTGVGAADSIVAKNVYGNPGLDSVGNSNWHLGSLDPRPTPGSLALTTTHYQMGGDPFFDAVTYAGAFSPDTNWMDGWTAMDQMGILRRSIRFFPASDNEAGTAINPSKFISANKSDLQVAIASNSTVNGALSTVRLTNLTTSATKNYSAEFQALWGAPTVLVDGWRYYRASTAHLSMGDIFTTYPGVGAGPKRLDFRLVLNNGKVLHRSFYMQAL